MSAAPTAPFKAYADAGFLGAVIPVVPPGAKLTPGSKLDADDLGKIPGVYNAEYAAWHGMVAWQTLEFTLDDIRKWNRWPKANIGLRAAHYPGLDIDCSVAAIVEHLRKLAFERLGPTLIRRREQTERILLPYRLKDGEQPPPKIKITFTVPGNTEKQFVEMLGAGQHYVIEGVHPKGGRYYWDDPDFSLAEVGAPALVKVTTSQWRAFADEVEKLLMQLGATVQTSSAGALDDASRKLIGDESLKAHDLGELVKALRTIPCADLDYSAWISHLHAAKAGSGGDEEFYHDVVMPWCLGYKQNTVEVIRDKWDSISSSTIDAEFIFGQARAHGYVGGSADAVFADTIPAPAPTPESERCTRRSSAPEMRLGGRYLDTHAEEAERILAEADLGVFCFGDRLVHPETTTITAADGRVSRGLRLVPVRVHWLRARLTEAIRFLKYDARAPMDQRWKETNCPLDLATVILEKGAWRFLPIRGFSNCPVFLRSGSILSKPGYHADSGLYVVDDGTSYPAISERPTRDDAMRALADLKELIALMPYASETDRAAALSGMLSAPARYAVKCTPLHAVTATGSRQGKSKHADMAAMLAEGHAAAATPPGSVEHELEKQLATCLRYGDGVISLDNIVDPIGHGALINSCFTQEEIVIRLFGKLERDKVPGNRLVFANGNALTVESDLVNRTILIRLDCPMEHPEERQFDWDPVDRIKADRGRYVAAALTILRAYHAAGCPAVKPTRAGGFEPISLTPMGGFEEWSALVRGALVWLGEADPRGNMEELRASDPERMGLAAVVEAWRAEFEAQGVEAKTLLEGGGDGTIMDRPLRAIIENTLDTNKPTVQRLGKWLQKMTGKVAGGLRIVKAGQNTHTRVALWRVEPIAGYAGIHD